LLPPLSLQGLRATTAAASPTPDQVLGALLAALVPTVAQLQPAELASVAHALGRLKVADVCRSSCCSGWSLLPLLPSLGTRWRRCCCLSPLAPPQLLSGL